MYAVWFLFKKNDSEYFEKIIDKLSEKYDAQPFKPHITAYGLVDIELEKLDKIVSNSIRDEKSFDVKKSNISYSDVFWKTLFVEFQSNKQLERINKKLTESLEPFNKYEFIPHASLIYKKMDESEQKKLAEKLDIKEKFTISGMCIQEFHEDISKWKIVRKYNLDSS